MSDVIHFSREFLTSLYLALPCKLVFGGIATYYIAKSLFLPVVIVVFNISEPIRERLNGAKTTKKYEAGKIYLHFFPRSMAPNTPNASPFGVKLESWLRLHKIDYEAVETTQFSKGTGQIPYVMYNGKELSDSNLVIDFFSQERGIDDGDGLTDEQSAAASAIIAMLDDQHSWTYFLHRYVYNFHVYGNMCLDLSSFPLLARLIFTRSITKTVSQRASGHGIGRKKEADVNRIAFSNLTTLAQYLSDKQYMMGDNITKVDCAVFGHLSQIIYIQFPYPHAPYIKAYCKNLLPYMERVKQALWPDWDDIVIKSEQK